MTSRARASSFAPTAMVLVLMLAGGCELEARAPLDLDAFTQPSQACVEVVHEALELGGPIHRVVADAGDEGGGWALVDRSDIEPPGLALVRIPATNGDELDTPIVPLLLTSNYAPAVELRAGATAGELWAILPGLPGQTLMKLVPELGLVAHNDALGNFPIAGPTPPCPTSFSRILVLAEGRPYVLAAPDCSAGAGLVLHLLAIEPESLAFGLSWDLEFDPCLGSEDPSACAYESAYSVPELSPPRTSLIVDSSRAPVGLSMVRSLDQSAGLEGAGVRTHDVALLDILIDPDGPDARLMTFREVWPDTLPVLLGPATVGRDLYSTQLFVRNLAGADDAALLRFDTAFDLYDLVRDPLPFGGAGELVQLESQSALVHVDYETGTLEAVGLADVDSWPKWKPKVLVELDDLVDVEQAGVGKLLLRRQEAAPQLISLNCP